MFQVPRRLARRIAEESVKVIREAAERGLPVYARRSAGTTIIVEGPNGRAVARPALLSPPGEGPLYYGLAEPLDSDPVRLGRLDTGERYPWEVPGLLSRLGLIPWQRADVWRQRLLLPWPGAALVEDECCAIVHVGDDKCLVIYHKALKGVVAWYNGRIGSLEITARWLARWRGARPDAVEASIVRWINESLPRLAAEILDKGE